MEKKTNNLKGGLILLVTAFIWGIAFVAQSDAASKIPPFAFNAIRSFIGAIMLLLLMCFRKIKLGEKIFVSKTAPNSLVAKGGIICGIMLWLSVNLQQMGLTYYEKHGLPGGSARGAFLTALYVVIVPILSLFFKRKVSPIIWVSTVIALLGAYLLCTAGLGGFNKGDILMLACALSFSLHVLSVDKFCNEVGGIRLSMIQFSVCAIVSLITSLIFETDPFNPENIIAAIIPILFLGIMSSGVAYTLQIIGQKYAEPAVASLTMSLESVFGALGGWIILGQTLTLLQIIGCTLVFIAIIIAQIPEILFNKKA